MSCLFTLHYITLHYITLHYIALHYTTLHCITLLYIALRYITVLMPLLQCHIFTTLLTFFFQFHNICTRYIAILTPRTLADFLEHIKTRLPVKYIHLALEALITVC